MLGVRQIHFKRVGCKLRLFATVYGKDKYLIDWNLNCFVCETKQTLNVDKGGQPLEANEHFFSCFRELTNKLNISMIFFYLL